MATVTKKVYFYKMNIFKEIHNSKEDKTDRKYLPENKIRNRFKDILCEENLTNNAMRIASPPTQETIEIIDHTDDFLFARLGRTKDDGTVHLRSRADLSAAEIEKKANEDIEVYTYFLFDFNTTIISFINTLSAPNISKFNKLSNDNSDFSNITEIVPILSDDVIDIITNKKIIKNMEISVAMPSDEIIGLDGIGISRSEFQEIASNNIKRQVLTFKVIGERDDNIFKGLSVKNFISKIFSSSSGEVRRFKVNAKDDKDETLTPYDLIKHKITQKETFQFNDNQKIYDKLLEVYMTKREELLRYINL